MKSTKENLLIVSKSYQALLQKRAKQVNLTVAEWQLLRLIVEGYNTQQLLAENTNLDVSTLSRQLSRLDAKRLIKKEVIRTEEKIRSRPASSYSLNEAGQASLDKMNQKFEELNQQIFYKFTPQVFTLTHKNPFFSFPLFPHIIIEQMAFTYKRSR